MLVSLFVGFLEAGAVELRPVFATIPVVTGAKPEPVPEYIAKAAYLLRFTKYVEWPEGTFAHETDPIVIAVLGDNPFGEVLEATVRDSKSNGRPVKVSYIKTAEEAEKCHVVFIAGWQKRDEAIWLHALRGKPVLTVAESDQGLAQGAVLSFVIERVSGLPKLRFDTNRQAARDAGLQIRAEMLQITRKFFREPTKPKDAP